jgi:hypothetical protein
MAAENQHAKVLSGTGFIVAIPCGDGPIKAYVRNSILTDNVRVLSS